MLGVARLRRGVDVKVETLLGVRPPRRLLPARVGELNIGPAGEQVEFIPLGFSVTDKDKLHRLRSVWCAIGASPNVAWRACRLFDAAKDTRFMLKVNQD